MTADEFDARAADQDPDEYDPRHDLAVFQDADTALADRRWHSWELSHG